VHKQHVGVLGKPNVPLSTWLPSSCQSC